MGEVNGAIERAYIYDGNSIVPTAFLESSNVYFIHRDHLSTPKYVTDASGSIVWESDQDAFGFRAESSGSIVLNLGFPGQYLDAESGLFYNYFRNYDPNLGRYLQSDPIGLRGGLNTYAYVSGNPLMFIDPFGLATLVPGEPSDTAPGDYSGGTDTVDGWYRQPCLVQCNDGSTTEYPHSDDIYDWLLDQNKDGQTIEEEIQEQQDNGWDDDVLEDQFCK